MTEPLTSAQLNELAADLDELESSLAELLESTESGTKPVQLKDNAGRLTRMAELHDQGILNANRNVIKNRLQQVKRAKQRVADGAYGYCAECDEPIMFQRLKAYPDSLLCIKCQSEAESGE
ncbi:MAG: TraR/DksA family transcriptional regulator [Pseudomonadales bacterium]|nr:TraR/DksA family transcriptional regulator [Pseudomonadales bacterium]